MLMKILYGARIARPDLLRAVQGLARYITKWTTKQDAELHRLVCYIKTTRDWRLAGWVGDDVKGLAPHLFSDADFAGCPDTMRATSGVHSVMRGEHSSFPIVAASKRQGCVSHSTTEAELVAADTAFRTAGLPLLGLWESYVGNVVTLHFHEDNKAMLDIVRTGRNPTLRYVSRTQGVSIKWLHEVYQKENIVSNYTSTSLMAADVFTKVFTDAVKWCARCEQIGVAPIARLFASNVLEVHHMFSQVVLTCPGIVTHGPGQLMPLGCEKWASKPGWHAEDECVYSVAKEPKVCRVIDGGVAAEFPLRTSWVLRHGQWRKFEENVPWQGL